MLTLTITFQAYGASFKATKKKAEKCNAKAQYKLGEMFSEGKLFEIFKACAADNSK